MLYLVQAFVCLNRMAGTMLVAYGPDGRPVVAEETTLEQLQRWSHERALYCPNCRGVVHVRGGPGKRTQLHFAHQKGDGSLAARAISSSDNYPRRASS